MHTILNKLGHGWQAALGDFFNSYETKALLDSVMERYETHTVFPRKQDILRAMELTDLHNVKIVIIGQDPYHGEGQANGLAFSVNKGHSIPPSLKNIFAELKANYPAFKAEHGDLTSWAKQGVLLLNTALTVDKDKPLSHREIGWDWFTRRVLDEVAKQNNPVIFMAWGAHAKSVMPEKIHPRHLYLTAAHPSPFSVEGFKGCNHFKKADAYLRLNRQTAIFWSLIDSNDDERRLAG